MREVGLYNGWRNGGANGDRIQNHGLSMDQQIAVFGRVARWFQGGQARSMLGQNAGRERRWIGTRGETGDRGAEYGWWERGWAEVKA